MIFFPLLSLIGLSTFTVIIKKLLPGGWLNSNYYYYGHDGGDNAYDDDDDDGGIIRLEEEDYKDNSTLSLEQPRDYKSKYLLVLPYEGLSNQVNGIVRGLELARWLGRRLIVPPLIRSQHEKLTCPEMEDWRNYYNFEDFSEKNELVFLEELLDLPETIPCYSFGRWKTWGHYGQSTRVFLENFVNLKFSLRWRPLKAPVDGRHFASVLSLLLDAAAAAPPIMAISQLQHVHFPNYVHNYLERLKFKNNVLSSLPKLSEDYIGVHWRRGDFKEACKNKKNPSSCYPKVSTLGHLIESDGGPSTIWISTNDPFAVQSFRITYPNYTFVHNNYTSSSCSLSFFIDQLMLINSTLFIGNPYSTLSRNVIIGRKQNGLPCRFF